MKSFILKYASKIMFYDVNIACYQAGAHSASTIAPAELLPNGAHWHAKARGNALHSTPVVRSLADNVAPAQASVP